MKSGEINIRDYLKVLVKWRKLILFNTALITLFAIVISFFLPKFYKAQTILLPPVEEQELIGLSSLVGGGALGGVGGLAKIAGMGGMATPSDVFAAILKSRTVAEGVIHKCDLLRIYKVKSLERALGTLANQTSVEVSPQGLITLSVETRNPLLSAEIANAYVDELDKFNKEVNMTKGRRTREFIEKRLTEAKKDLALAEEALRKFQEKNRTISLTDEMTQAIEAAAKLKAEIISREVQLGVLKTYATENNPQVIQIKNEIGELTKQLNRMEYGPTNPSSPLREVYQSSGAGFSIPFTKIPGVGLELARLTRNLKIMEEVFGLLTQQYETAKIAEAKDTPTIQVLDRAVPPEFKSKPRKLFIWIIAFFMSLFVGIFLAFFLEYLEKMRQREEEYQDWQRITKELAGDFRNLKNKLLRRREN